jgi:acetoacetate decarboxylase
LRACALSLARYFAQGRRGRPAALQLFAHVLGNVAKIPVLDVLSGTQFIADLALGIGEVMHDFLA